MKSDNLEKEYKKLVRKQEDLITKLICKGYIEHENTDTEYSHGRKRFFSWVFITIGCIVGDENFKDALPITWGNLFLISAGILILVAKLSKSTSEMRFKFQKTSFQVLVPNDWNFINIFKTRKAYRNISKLYKLNSTLHEMNSRKPKKTTNNEDLTKIKKENYSPDKLYNLIVNNNEFIFLRKNLETLEYTIKAIKPYTEVLSHVSNEANTKDLYDFYTPIKNLNSQLTQYVKEENSVALLFILSLSDDLYLINKYISGILDSVITKELSAEKIKNLKLFNEDKIVSKITEINLKLSQIDTEISNYNSVLKEHNEVVEDINETRELISLKEKITTNID